jgi:hypothetical protein
MVAARQPGPDRLSRAIRQQQATVIAEHRIPEGGLHAHARGAAGEHQVLDAQTSEDEVQLGLIEATEAVFRNDNVGGLGCQLIDDIRVSGVPDKDAAWRTVRASVCVADADDLMHGRILRVLIADVRQIRPELHLEIDNLQSCAACRRQHAAYRGDDVADRGDVHSGVCQRPVLAYKVVLHVDDDDGCLAWLHHERLRPSVDRQGAADRIHGFVPLSRVTDQHGGVEPAVHADPRCLGGSRRQPCGSLASN